MYRLIHHSCKGVKEVEFEAHGDFDAADKGCKIIDDFEKEEGVIVYRESLHRIDGEEEIEIAI